VYPVVYGGGGSYGSIIATNLGSTEAPVTIRINGPVTNPTVRNVTTGESLGLTVVLAAGEFMDLDTKNHTVLLGGTANRYSTLTTPQWWGLQPGTNEIRYFADITSASTVTVTYRSAWV
jgi:phage-related protein